MSLESSIIGFLEANVSIIIIVIIVLFVGSKLIISILSKYGAKLSKLKA